MHGTKNSSLFNSGEKGQLNHFNEELLNEVAKECSENFLVLQFLIRKKDWISKQQEMQTTMECDMVPPKDPYIKVRVIDDDGEGIVVSDKAANFARHSMHFLKRTDAELYILRGLMEELTG
ncbi:hypothetical protein EZV62_004217 [Acer yangbiense]|uniref:DNA replication complex GINS protein PSF1 C-terminal domain-containing protein n=1 Tax=Acer yangbiense TaxID=1000413 RepID=A0A5C7IKY6_9ROSI|nr:hypothetical protein EZV62_004217 [Acer yangbiense]